MRDYRRGDLDRAAEYLGGIVRREEHDDGYVLVRKLPSGKIWVETVSGRLHCDHPHTEPATVEQVVAACRSAVFVDGVPWPELSRPDR